MLVACLGDVMLDVIVETAGAAGHRRRHPAPRSPSPPAARPPTSRPGWPPSAAAARVFGPRADTGPGPPGRGGADRARRRGVGHRDRPHRRGGVAGHRRHPLDGLRPRRPELARRGPLRRRGSRAPTGCSSPATRCCAPPTRSGSSRPPPWPARTAPAIAVDLSSAAMVADFGADAFSDAVRGRCGRPWCSRPTPSGRTSRGRRSAPAATRCWCSSTARAARRSWSTAWPTSAHARGRAGRRRHRRR